MSYQVRVIENKESFDVIYPTFSEGSLLTRNPDTHFIGLDTEYICETNFPDLFREGIKWINNKYQGRIAVCKLQISTADLCLVIDLCKFDGILPQNLINILTSDAWIKCGVGISNDLLYLSNNFQLGQCNGGYEMRTLALLAGFDNPSLENIYSRLYNTDYEKVKRYSCSNWTNDMTIEMVRYASEDAYISYMIGIKLFQTLKTSLSSTFASFKTNDDHKMEKRLADVTIDGVNKINWIGRLQEFAQKNKFQIPIYESTESDNTEFRFCVICQFENFIQNGYGNNKQEAKQDASLKMFNLCRQEFS